jgi:hypothetical protein
MTSSLVVMDFRRGYPSDRGMMTVMVMHLFGEDGKRGEPHLPLLRTYHPLSGGGDTGAQAVNQFSAEPPLK